LLRQKIKEKALELGFSFCGFAEAGSLEEEKVFFTSYLRDKRNAGLHYLARESEKRFDPKLVFPGTRTVIGLLFNYYPTETLPEKDNFIISRYAYGKDYHIVLKDHANALIQFMKEEKRSLRAKAFVDSGSLLEKAWARRCGIGWIGKNTLLVNPTRGSFHFITIILTDLAIEPDVAEIDHCGTCRCCLDACPSGALEHPYELHPSRCLSYLTIEEKEEIPDVLKEKMNARIFGCDICQDICPFNRFAVPHTIPEFNPSETLRSFRKDDWRHLTEDEFRIMFTGTAVQRTGYQKLISNIRDAIGEEK
jgi:epoxyqueuosine reductase